MRTVVGLVIWESSGLLEAGWRLRYDQPRNFPEENSHGHLAKTATSSRSWRSAGETPSSAAGGGAWADRRGRSLGGGVPERLPRAAG